MKCLVATKQGQGIRPNDFSWTDDGEFLGFSFECDREGPDGSCGCRRSFSGLASFRATTTAIVVEKGITEEQFVELHRAAMRKAGWLNENTRDPNIFDDQARGILRLAAKFPAFSVIEKRGDVVQIRKGA